MDHFLQVVLILILIFWRLKKKGNFHENKKCGKGHYHLANGVIYQEEWDNGILKSQVEQVVLVEEANSTLQKIDKRNSKEKEESKSNEISPHLKSKENHIEEQEEQKNMEIEPMKEVSKEFEDNMTSEQKNLEEPNIHSHYETENNMDFEAHLLNKYESKFESTAEKDLLSEVKSELKTIDAGFDTLTLIEQIEMFNSLNSSFLNKNSKFY